MIILSGMAAGLNGGTSPSNSTDTWQWNIEPTSGKKSYTNSSSFFEGNELPSNIWQHDTTNYGEKYSWQVKGSPDWFNSFELITFTRRYTSNSEELELKITPNISVTSISDLYNLNYFKYSPGIWDFTDLFRSNFETFTVFTCYRRNFIPYCAIKSFWYKQRK